MAAKDVSFGGDARARMVEGVNILANAVKVTLEHHVAALGTERDLDCVGEDVDTLDHARAGLAAE